MKTILLPVFFSFIPAAGCYIMPLLHAVNTRNLQHPLETLFLFSTLESDLEILITTISRLVELHFTGANIALQGWHLWAGELSCIILPQSPLYLVPN